VKWRLINVTGSTSTQTKDRQGNIIISTAPSIAIFGPVDPTYRTRPNRSGTQLLIYRSEGRLTAYLTGHEGQTITDRLPQERWDEIHSQACAAFNMLGRVPDNLVQEII
jgi:hypothetical protein